MSKTADYLTPIPADWQATLAIGSNKSAKPGEWRNKIFDLDTLISSLTTHRIGTKDGQCFLQGQATKGVRQARAMDPLYIIGIDVDNGMPSDEIDAIIKERGIFAIRYTTHSHGKDYTEESKDAWIKYLRANPGATISDYLVAKKRYLPEIAEKAEITGEEMSISGVVLTISHPAMDKNRVICVLAKPWSVMDYDTQEDALKAWKDAYMGFASWLGIVVDQSCTDTARLFYSPRRDPGGLSDSIVHEGQAVNIFALPRSAQSRTGNAFSDAAKEMGATEGNRTMRAWAAKYADRFLIVDALETHAPGMLRPEGDHGAVRHIECPFESGHSTYGGSGTFVSNAGESQSGSFTVSCRHGSCQDRDRLDFLCEMLDREWLPPEAIIDNNFLIELEEEDDVPAPAVQPKPSGISPELANVRDAATADMYVKALAETEIPPILAAQKIIELVELLNTSFNIRLTRGDLNSAYKTYLRTFTKEKKEAEAEAMKAAIEKAKDAEKDKEQHKKNVARDKKRDAKEKEEPNRVAIYVDTDHLKSVDTALDSLREHNAKNPFIFRNAGALCRIIWDEQKFPRSERMGPKDLRFELTRVTRYLKDGGDGLLREVAPTQEVVDDIIANPDTQFPVLSGIVTAPVFGPDATIDTEPGYNPSSQLYFNPVGDIAIAPVPNKPTRADLEKAKDLMMGNVLVDFPFDGPNNGESERAHALCMFLQPFVRQLIVGSTPIYLIVKPTPGTGASKLVNIYSLISTGEDAVAQSETRSEDELRKRITAVLLESANTFYLDNINYRIDSSALASAVTTSMWTDRMLGETKTVRVPVRHTWIFCGNNPTMSNEIARRCVRIRLDAKVERPELRSNFKHKDLEGWVRDNRSELIWACLTLIQNWVAKGRPAGEAIKGSFEPWSRVMGGILTAAGFAGFLENDKEMREASDEEGNAIKELISCWWSSYQGQVVTVGGMSNSLFELYKDEEIALPINGVTSDQQKISFGKYLNKLSGRIFTVEDDSGGSVKLKIEKSASKKDNKVCWVLAETT